MKLVLYGGGDAEDNETLDQKLLSLAGKRRPKMTFIPSCSYDAEVDFLDFIDRFSTYGLTQFIHFPVDIPFDQVLLKEAFKSDIIYLDGGNTYYFLKYLRKSKLIPMLKRYLLDGGILAGLSAGAILMTPSIATAGFPEFDKDENYENMKNLKAMNLVPFEFFPHYKSSRRYDLELIKHSKKIRRPLYASADGAGIIFDGEGIQFVGRNFVFNNGQKISMKQKKSFYSQLSK